MKIGAHVSIQGGLEKAIERAGKIGADCLQIFGSPPRSWRSPAHSREAVMRFRHCREGTGIGPVFIHTIYLLNLASADQQLWKRSVESLRNCLRLAQTIGAAGVVAHPGSAVGSTLEEGEARVMAALEEAVLGAESIVPVLLETSAGSGNAVGSSFESLGRIASASGIATRVGVCLATAHVFAAGYDVASADGLNCTLETFDRAIGLEWLALVHVNDSKAALGSRVDRHENIGCGRIGAEGIGRILRHPELKLIPFVTEVPGIDGAGPGERDLATLRALAQEEDPVGN